MCQEYVIKAYDENGDEVDSIFVGDVEVDGMRRCLCDIELTREDLGWIAEKGKWSRVELDEALLMTDKKKLMFMEKIINMLQKATGYVIIERC